MSDAKIKYKENVISQLKKELGLKNALACPRLIKIVVNTGVGRKEEKDIEIVAKHLEMIVGQKCAPKKAKKSIATFKTRKGVVVGLACALRGARMYDFFERLISVALPRLRDFRGIDPKTIDSSGNLTIGLKEHIVFPEIAGEDIKVPFGLEVTLVTSARSKAEAAALFKALGVPFKK
ncbi:MAG: 50S ribosomal protein L5 [Patescibacteria group bacterium]|mgnify:CR=1 FL=1